MSDKQVQENATLRVMENSVICLLRFTKLQPKRKVSTDNVEVDADKSMLHVAKDILDAEELREIVCFDQETTSWFRKRCTIADWVRGYILPVAMFDEAIKYLEEREAKREALVARFIEVYPRKIDDARERLKELFIAAEYPAVKVVQETFSMKYTFIEWGTPKRLQSVNIAAYEKEKAKAEASWATTTEKIDQALAAGMQFVVNHLVTQLTGEKNGKPKRVHASALTKVEEFLAAFEKRNLSGNANLAEMADTARKALNGIDVKTLKSRVDLRQDVIEKLKTVTGSLDKMLVDAPKRLMSLADEEV
jgi:vacuolar-type H+-ATPase subunit H